MVSPLWLPRQAVGAAAAVVVAVQQQRESAHPWAASACQPLVQDQERRQAHLSLAQSRAAPGQVHQLSGQE
jgi:hypothetical protein